MVAAGDPVEASDITTIEDYTIRRPICRLVQNVVQSIPNGVETPLTFTSEEIDTHGFHDNSTNTSRITPTVAGYYRFTFGFILANYTSTSLISTCISKNGIIQQPRIRNASPTGGAKSWQLSVILSANGTSDYFEGQGRQDTGAAVNTSGGGSGYSSTFECEFLRPL